MNKIGAIINYSDSYHQKRVDYIHYLTNIDEYLEICKLKSNQNNYKIPVLCIGWDFVKKNNITEIFRVPTITILNKEIVKNQSFWEFNMNEDISGYFSGVENFIKYIPYHYINNFKYRILDPCTVPDVATLNKLLPSGSNSYIFKNEMAYVYNDQSIIGIHLESFKYFRYDVDEILQVIKSKSVNYFQDVEGLEYQKCYKKFPEFPYLKRSMVVFMF